MHSAVSHSARLLGSGALEGAVAALQAHGLGAELLLVCDDTTWVAAGQALHRCLIDADLGVTAHSLGRIPKATLAHGESVMGHARERGATGLLAVGSGTVNDITKYAAHRLGLPYICVATAASMNGYASANASLEDDQRKQSYAAAAPRAIIADLNIIAAAPRRYAKAGLGDTLCHSTVLADRYLSHCVLGTPFEREWFERQRTHEQWLKASSHLLRENDPAYFHRLMTALLDAGDAMNAAGSSAVASQSEHMVAHTLELLYGKEIRECLHGEMVAVTATSMAALQHKLLLSQPQLRHYPREEAQFCRIFGKKHGPELAVHYARKVLPAETLEAANAAFQKQWPEIKTTLLAMIAPANAIERAYKQAGLVTHSMGLGLMPERYHSALGYAYLTRDRFTFLDLGAMNGRRM